jgi:hypothetical protein
MADNTSAQLTPVAKPVHTRRAFPLNLTLATLLTLAASVCLWLAGFSTPFIKRIYYLVINQEGGDTKFGAFGYCHGGDSLSQCSNRAVGVSFFSLSLLNDSADPST